MAYFQLQPAELDLQQLAEQYWQEAGERERQLEAAAYEAGEAIRNGEYTLPNLETIVRWKSERMVHYLIGNSSENIRSALAVAASPDASAEDAVNALIALRGVDISIASAILAAIYPERYAVLDYRALEALGHARHDVASMPNTYAILQAIWPSAGSSSRKPICPAPRRSTRWSARSGSGRSTPRSSSRPRVDVGTAPPRPAR